MSEQAPVTPVEQAPQPAERQAELARSIHEHAEKAPTAEQIDRQAEQARSVIEHTSEPSAPLALPVDDSKDGDQPQYIDRALQKIGLNQQLKQIRRKLPASQRTLSKVVHQPVVKAVSEVSAKTITRPSGLLGGGICAFLGSSGYLYLAKHIGFQYNYLVFLLLFVGGFAVGLALELLLSLFRPKHLRSK